jgi:acyl-CoA synthetase (AMP-forming)/AMP-acid ligase II
MLRLFLEEPESARCHSLRLVICSGEPLPFDLQEEFFRKASAELHNLYGPTEAAVDVTNWACQRRSGRTVVPIGRPLSNTRAYIMDRHSQPVPVGVPGELHLGGVQVGRGYHQRPDLTAEKFVPDPFGASWGARLYRTGDLCRWLSDGEIEYLGRLDHQVKFRGFRIELGEIEEVLRQHPAIHDAVVVAPGDGPGAKGLAAYVVADGRLSPPADELRTFLRQKLPDYMLPALYIYLQHLPLTPNGKVDRKALPKPTFQSNATTLVLPSTPTEVAVAKIWCEVLGLKQVGVHDNFFELGGHSLLAARVVSRISATFMVGFSLRTLFEHPTLLSFAKQLALLLWVRNESDGAPPCSAVRLVEGKI